MNTRRTAAILALTAVTIGGTATAANAGTKWTAPPASVSTTA